LNVKNASISLIQVGKKTVKTSGGGERGEERGRGRSGDSGDGKILSDGVIISPLEKKRHEVSSQEKRIGNPGKAEARQGGRSRKK